MLEIQLSMRRPTCILAILRARSLVCSTHLNDMNKSFLTVSILLTFILIIHFYVNNAPCHMGHVAIPKKQFYIVLNKRRYGIVMEM